MADGDKSHLDEQQRTELRLDYQQTMQYIQMLTNIRFLPLTLLPGLTAAAVTVLTRFDNPRTALVVALMGLFVSVMIILYDLQNTALHDAAVYRAKSIERSLRLPPFTKHKQVGGLFNESPQRIAVAPRGSIKNPGLDPFRWTPESLEAKPPERESTCRIRDRATQRSLRLRPFS